MNDEEEFSPPQNFAATAPAESKEFRGVGEIFKRKPIAAVVEILRREPLKDPQTGAYTGKWRFVRPFTGIPEGSQFAFHIMQSVPTAKNQRGQPIREPHPMFEAFNTCHPEKARTLRARIVNWLETDAYKNYLGAYKPPEGSAFKAPEKGGFWCQGDAVRARRYINGEFKDIPCPNRLCDYSQEGSGPRGQGTHCKPHIELVAQFNWSEESKLPRVLFEWDSQSWNNVSNIEGMFQQINDLASRIGFARGKFPLVNLQFTMNLKERHKAGGGNRKAKNFPEVSFSVDGDIMQWMQGNAMLAQNSAQMQQVQLEAPAPLGALPPPGYTAEQMREASDATLNPRYEPKNVRSAHE